MIVLGEKSDIINLAVVNFRAVWGEKVPNLAKIKSFIRAAARQGVNLILFPEMALTGYSNEPDVYKMQKMQIRLAERIPGPSTREIEELAKHYRIYVVFGMPEKDPLCEDVVYNSAVAIGPDGIIGVYRKIHPALEEPFWCNKGSEPFMFETEWGNVGIGICYDTYVFHELSRFYAASGCRLFLNPTAMAIQFDWKNFYCDTLRQIVNTNEVFVASANLTGVENIRVNKSGIKLFEDEKCTKFPGGSIIFGPGLRERVHTYGGDVGNSDPTFFIATLDLSLASRNFYKTNPLSGKIDYRPDLYLQWNRSITENQES